MPPIGHDSMEAPTHHLGITSSSEKSCGDGESPEANSTWEPIGWDRQ